MSKPQRKAAKAIGYTKASWETGEGAPDSDDKYWSELTQEQQGNATIIGFTPESWDVTAIYCQDWVYLIDELKAAASLLGKIFVSNLFCSQSS